MTPWNSFSAYLRRLYGQRVQKIPLDAGATCPNRDGTLGREGCIFCNAAGSGTGLGGPLAAQWDYWRAHFLAAGRSSLFMAYLQSYSNTYGPLERLARLVDDIAALPDRAGLSVGTRPDCLDAEKAALLASLPGEVWLELGVQTFHEATLRRIRRGHDVVCAERAIPLAAGAGLKVCVHLIAGLPGETDADFMASVRRLGELPVHGVKFHNLYVCQDTPLAEDFRAGRYVPMPQADYVRLMADTLDMLRPDILVHRLVADPAPGELLAPDWALEKHLTQLDIEKTLRARHPELAKGAARKAAKARKLEARARAVQAFGRAGG